MDTPVGVLRAIVILPSRLDVVVLHLLLRQTSTCPEPRARATSHDPATADSAWMTGKPDCDLKAVGMIV